MSHARATSPMAQSCTVSARGYDVQAYMHYFYYAPVTGPKSWWEPCSSGRRHAARVAWPGVSCGGTPPGSSRRPPCRPAWWPVPRRDRPAVRPAAPCLASARTRHRRSAPAAPRPPPRRLPQPGCFGRRPWSTNPFCRGLRPSSSVVAPTGALRARRDHSMAISPKDTPERGRPCSVAVAIHRPLGSQRAPSPTLASLAKRRRNGTCALIVPIHRESQVTTLWLDRGLQEG